MARRVLDLYGVEIVDDVEIVVSELTTNAVRVSRPDWTVTLRLLIDQEAVLVAVHDESDELPEIRDVGLDETAGRGLLIVEPSVTATAATRSACMAARRYGL